jgi:hypothetical protein
MLRMVRITIAVMIALAVLTILIHPHIDGLDSIARAHRSHRVFPLFFFGAYLLYKYNGLAAFTSITIQNATSQFLAQICTLRC